jgi:hypothetical protein
MFNSTNGSVPTKVSACKSESLPKEDVLDRMADIVRRGRRDRNAIRRIVHEYGIPNDAGIGETIVDRTVESVANAVAHYDREHLPR